METYLKKYGTHSLVISLALIVLSVFLIFKPVDSINVLMIIFGVIVSIDGLIHFISYFASPKELRPFSFELAQGILEVVAGFVFITHPGWLIAILPFIIGIWIILESIIKFQLSINMKDMPESNWIIMLILSIITIALGALIIANPTQTAAVAVSLCGVGLLISESLNAIECVYIMMKLK